MRATSKTQSILKPKRVPPGATIGIVGPASPVDPARLSKGIAQLEQLGFKTVTPLDPSALYSKDTDYGNDRSKSRNTMFGSASAEQRAKAFMDLVTDKNVAAIFAARGGYSSAEILALLDYDTLRKHPKPIVGFSDITSLLTGIYSQSGIVTFHGPAVAVEFSRFDSDTGSRESVELLMRLLKGEKITEPFKCSALRDGKSSGRILAGNLTMLRSLLGTPYDCDYAGKILVIEEVNEQPYRVHRDLLQLKLAGKFDKLAGLVYGRFSKSESPSGNNSANKSGPTVEDVIQHSIHDLLAGTDFPVLFGLDFGHGGKNIPMPIGCEAAIESGSLMLREEAVS